MPNPPKPRPKPPADPAADPAALSAWLAVVRTYHLCDALMARRLAAAGVRTPEHEILSNVRREPGIGQQTLAQRCFTAKSHVSGLVGEMEARGWLRREPDPQDARAKRLFLAPAGEAVARRTAAVQAEVVALMAAAAPPAAIAQVGATMRLVGQALQAELDAPEPPAP
jgi:DNA-binding MarR family transcriptional regulator